MVRPRRRACPLKRFGGRPRHRSGPLWTASQVGTSATGMTGWRRVPTCAGTLRRILRKWQAARPGAVRRLRREARHGAPFLDELLAEAEEPLHLMANLSVATVSERTPAQDEALAGLWSIFSRLRISGVTSCVGITKAILLLTDGKIGPAFDSRVRANLGVARPSTCSEWLQALENIAEDIAMFERQWVASGRGSAPLRKLGVRSAL